MKLLPIITKLVLAGAIGITFSLFYKGVREGREIEATNKQLKEEWDQKFPEYVHADRGYGRCTPEYFLAYLKKCKKEKRDPCSMTIEGDDFIINDWFAKGCP